MPAFCFYEIECDLNRTTLELKRTVFALIRTVLLINRTVFCETPRFLTEPLTLLRYASNIGQDTSFVTAFVITTDAHHDRIT